MFFDEHLRFLATALLAQNENVYLSVLQKPSTLQCFVDLPFPSFKCLTRPELAHLQELAFETNAGVVLVCQGFTLDCLFTHSAIILSESYFAFIRRAIVFRLTPRPTKDKVLVVVYSQDGFDDLIKRKQNFRQSRKRQNDNACPRQTS